MILIDVLSGNLLPLPYIYNYIILYNYRIKYASKSYKYHDFMKEIRWAVHLHPESCFVHLLRCVCFKIHPCSLFEPFLLWNFALAFTCVDPCIEWENLHHIDMIPL